MCVSAWQFPQVRHRHQVLPLPCAVAQDDKLKRTSATNSNKTHNLTYGEVRVSTLATCALCHREVTQLSQVHLLLDTQVTPASIEAHVLSFHGHMTDADVFYDLGSGDGKILVQALLAMPLGAAKGIEFAAGREAGAQSAKKRLMSVTESDIVKHLQTLPAPQRAAVCHMIQSASAPPPPTGDSGKAAASASSDTEEPDATAGSQSSDEDDPGAPSVRREGGRTPARAGAGQEPSSTPGSRRGGSQDMASRRTPGSSRVRRVLASPDDSEDGEEDKPGKVEAAAAALVPHLRSAGERLHSIRGDFIVQDFSDASHVFINNTVFEADLMAALLAKLAQLPKLHTLTVLRKLCYRHSRRCCIKGEACAAFEHPPTEGICWVSRPVRCSSTLCTRTDSTLARFAANMVP